MIFQIKTIKLYFYSISCRIVQNLEVSELESFENSVVARVFSLCVNHTSILETVFETDLEVVVTKCRCDMH